MAPKPLPKETIDSQQFIIDGVAYEIAPEKTREICRLLALHGVQKRRRFQACPLETSPNP